MSSGDELLILRLGLLAIIFGFVLVASVMLRSGLRPRERGRPRAVRQPAGARAAAATLVVLSPARTGVPPGAAFSLAGEMTLGRDLENGIVLADASVSGRHAVVRQARQRWLVEDLGSTNGTLVNGRALNGRRAELRDGDRLTVGAVVFRFDS